jgi:hypothetical protein
MFMPGLPPGRDQDRNRPPRVRLGLGQAVGILQQRRQLVEAAGDVGVVGAEPAPGDRQRPPHQRLGLGQVVGGLQ